MQVCKMSEKDYVLDSIATLKSLIKFFTAVLCAVISFLISEYKSGDQDQLLLIASFVALFIATVCIILLSIAYKKYLNRLRKLK